ncbi:hypothetical protein GCM10022211_09990 [Sphingomonas humi]|uniref:Uncharacterized protein n=1 Tax=Sphingomonas humi TaxID=335630 RepID=A0ABP7RRK7_9SPHN
MRIVPVLAEQAEIERQSAAAPAQLCDRASGRGSEEAERVHPAIGFEGSVKEGQLGLMHSPIHEHVGFPAGAIRRGGVFSGFLQLVQCFRKAVAA